MATLTFDTLKFANRLKEAGVKEKEAEAIIEIMQEAQNGADFATKRDLAEAKTELVKWVVSVGILQFALIAALMMKLTG